MSTRSIKVRKGRNSSTKLIMGSAHSNAQMVGRATKKSELRNKVDREREEALESKVKLQAVKARIFVLFKKI